MLHKNLVIDIMVPFIGTAAGAAAVFFMKKALNKSVELILSGFAAGVMTASAVWSLLLPALEQSEDMNIPAFIPPTAGFLGGVFVFILIDKLLAVFEKSFMKKNNAANSTSMLIFAVTIHNIPEGMAVGIICAEALLYGTDSAFAAAAALSTGIAIQNLPEGAIVSLPYKAGGAGKLKSFLVGLFSGAVEPVAAFSALIAAHYVVGLMPYFLSFAAGAMFFVVVNELIPKANTKTGAAVFALGFVVMMSLDVIFG